MTIKIRMMCFWISRDLCCISCCFGVDVGFNLGFSYMIRKPLVCFSIQVIQQTDLQNRSSKQHMQF